MEHIIKLKQKRFDRLYKQNNKQFHLTMEQCIKIRRLEGHTLFGLHVSMGNVSDYCKIKEEHKKEFKKQWIDRFVAMDELLPSLQQLIGKQTILKTGGHFLNDEGEKNKSTEKKRRNNKQQTTKRK